MAGAISGLTARGVVTYLLALLHLCVPGTNVFASVSTLWYKTLHNKPRAILALLLLFHDSLAVVVFVVREEGCCINSHNAVFHESLCAHKFIV